MPGPYTIPNVQVDAHCVYTNRTPSSAMRGFGVTIGDFALEVQMDKLARLIGMDPLEFRIHERLSRRRHEGASARRPTGAALIECMQAASKLADWPVGRAVHGDVVATKREAEHGEGAGAASPRSTIRPA